MQFLLSTSLIQETLAELTEYRALAPFSSKWKKWVLATLIPTIFKIQFILSKISV